METRKIGDMDVPVLCLGTMTFGTPVGEREGIEIVRRALELGIRFVDTANMYEGYTRYIGSPGGVAEEILGKALADRRERVVLATKVGMKVGHAPEDEGTSPAAIRRQLDRSLQRLQTDSVDIYYLHRPDPDVPLADVLGALHEAIGQGKIRHYGVSNYSAEELAELLKVADENRLPRPVIHQPPYSLLKRDVEEDLLPLCQREDMAVAPYQALQGGLLTGKYRRDESPPTGSRKKEKAAWLPDLDDALFDRLEQIKWEAEATGRTMMEHAIRSVLEQPAVVSVVLGVKRIDQLEALVNMAD